MTHKLAGAVSVGNRTYLPGDEAEFDKAVAAQKEDKVDMEALKKSGVLADGEPVDATVNMQRTETGGRADASAAKAHDEKKAAAQPVATKKSAK